MDPRRRLDDTVYAINNINEKKEYCYDEREQAYKEMIEDFALEFINTVNNDVSRNNNIVKMINSNQWRYHQICYEEYAIELINLIEIKKTKALEEEYQLYLPYIDLQDKLNAAKTKYDLIRRQDLIKLKAKILEHSFAIPQGCGKVVKQSLGDLPAAQRTKYQRLVNIAYKTRYQGNGIALGGHDPGGTPVECKTIHNILRRAFAGSISYPMHTSFS